MLSRAGQHVPPISWWDLLALSGQQPFNGLPVLSMLIAIVAFAMGLSILLLRNRADGRSVTRKTPVPLLVLVTYFLLTAAYFILRFAAKWTAGDMTVLGMATEHLRHSGSFSPETSGRIYPHGVGYQALSLFLVEVGGISLETLQTHLLPFVAAIVVVVAFVAYRSLTGTAQAATIAVFLVCLQPDFLFVVFRGSHEKITWSLVLLALFILTRSFSETRRTGRLIKLVLLFYFVVLALIATNSFFGSSFIAALAVVFSSVSLLLAVRRKVGEERINAIQPHVARLLYATLACAGLHYVFIIYLYPAAGNSLRALRVLSDQLVSLLLNFEPQFDPYAYVSTTWHHPLIYPLLSLFSYVILLVSFAVWTVGLLRLFKRDGLAQVSFPRLLLWFLYPGFALQLGLSVLVDRTGWVGGNLQVRLFTPMMLVSIPLVALGLSRLWSRIRLEGMPRIVLGIVVILFGWFSMAALLKASNEPVLSNRWMFYTEAERTAGAWGSRYMPQGKLWVGFDVRMHSAMSFLFGAKSGELSLDAADPDVGVTSFLLSQVEQERFRRQGLEWPSIEDAIRVYDNGPTQIYHGSSEPSLSAR